MPKKILFIDSNHPRLHEMLMQQGFICDLFYDKPADELKKLIPHYDGIVLRSKFKITKEIIDSAPNLKCIARVGAGMENIDVAYAEKKGIACVNSPEGNRDAVAEHALGMLLALFNNLIKANAEVRLGKWLREENRGIELCGKTVGIIGYGNMGAAFVKRLQGFGVKILAYDKYKTNFGNDFVQESRIEEIFEQADVLSLHTPLTDETNYLINDAFIKRFKKNIYIINTARGKCLNTADLIKNLESGKVLGACLDVLEYEAVSFEGIDVKEMPAPLQYLIKSDKVILSPHIAGWTQESNIKLAEFLAEKIIAVLK
ncbi:MAG TPA: 2-hydroxyacid dehydrogenase [Bacteroidia bacterium]|jgi:D-3-phosphoglycerate dehydrogenase|nr:2-hydroxyacid dehydrogenase [Bacteroidia bacterium]